MEMKQNQTFFHGTYSNLTSFCFHRRNWNVSVTFIIDIFQFQQKSEHKQVKCNGTRAKVTVFFLIYKVVHYLNYFRNLFVDTIFFHEKTIFFPSLNFLNIMLKIRLSFFMKFFVILTSLFSLILDLIRFITNNKCHFLNNGSRKEL